MTNFDNLDITNGFVINEQDAIKYIEDSARQHIEEVMQGNEDTEGLTEIIEDLYGMKKWIMNNNYDYYHFIEHPMYACGMCITPMTEAKQ